MARYQIETKQTYADCDWLGCGTENGIVVYAKALRGKGYTTRKEAIEEAEKEAKRCGVPKRVIDTRTGEILAAFAIDTPTAPASTAAAKSQQMAHNYHLEMRRAIDRGLDYLAVLYQRDCMRLYGMARMHAHCACMPTTPNRMIEHA